MPCRTARTTPGHQLRETRLSNWVIRWHLWSQGSSSTFCAVFYSVPEGEPIRHSEKKSETTQDHWVGNGPVSPSHACRPEHVWPARCTSPCCAVPRNGQHSWVVVDSAAAAANMRSTRSLCICSARLRCCSLRSLLKQCQQDLGPTELCRTMGCGFGV